MDNTRLETRGGESNYSAPKIDIIDVRIEQGFANSPNGILDYSEGGDAGFTGGDDNNLGEF